MEFIIYLLKVNLAILLFYSLYRIFSRKDTFFQWKRILFLGMIGTSLVYPLLKLSGLFLPDKVSPGNFISASEGVAEKIGQWIYTLPEIVITGKSQVEPSGFSFIYLILGLYMAGVIFLFIRFFFQLISLARIIIYSEKTNYKGHIIHVKKGIETPFSFLGWIVLDSEQHTESDLEEILSHETTHIRQFHSLDAITSELFGIFCWFNPVAWLLKREIRMNLEYLADRSVIASGFDSEHYQFHLLRLCHHKAAAKLSNNFNVSPLKSRITMMNKKETSLWNIAKYALFMPLLLLLVFISNCTGNAKEKENKNESESVVVSTIEEPTPPVVTEPAPPVVTEPADEQAGKTQVYSHVEVPPQFPGKEQGLMKWLQDNIQYPKDAQEKGIQGRVVLRFVVEPDGSINDVKVQRSLNPACDKEAVRVVSAMPKWEPGTQKGKAVPVYYTLPVLFRLEK